MLPNMAKKIKPWVIKQGEVEVNSTNNPAYGRSLPARMGALAKCKSYAISSDYGDGHAVYISEEDMHLFATPDEWMDSEPNEMSLFPYRKWLMIDTVRVCVIIPRTGDECGYPGPK